MSARRILYLFTALALALAISALIVAGINSGKTGSFYNSTTIVVTNNTTGSLNAWQEYANDPIYNPYGNTPLDEDYFPCVLFDGQGFLGSGNNSLYKMWHQAPSGGIGLSVSVDGVVWTLAALTNLQPAYHICVLYSSNGFNGTSPYSYRAWYWTGTPTTTIVAIQHAESNDGVTWVNMASVTQDVVSPLVTGIFPSLLYHLYGPSFVTYNPVPANVAGSPFTYRYTMFYDISSEGSGPGSSVEACGLAYSTDGFHWTRYGQVPVLIPQGSTSLYGSWDNNYAYRVSMLWDSAQRLYHLFYSGSNSLLTDGIVYAHGIGHAVSRDGVTWATDWTNPVFYFNNGVAWRSGRTYAPSVLRMPNGTLQMWFSGGSGSVAGVNQSIGYATAQSFG